VLAGKNADKDFTAYRTEVQKAPRADRLHSLAHPRACSPGAHGQGGEGGGHFNLSALNASAYDNMVANATADDTQAWPGLDRVDRCRRGAGLTGILAWQPAGRDARLHRDAPELPAWITQHLKPVATRKVISGGRITRTGSMSTAGS